MPVQIPIGAEENFQGVVDLIEMKAVRWFEDQDKGMNYTLEDIPADIMEQALEWRRKLIESVAEVDDVLLERYFDDPDSITKEEMLPVIRRATIEGIIVPMMCGSAFKNKGIQRLLDSICAFLPSPWIMGMLPASIL